MSLSYIALVVVVMAFVAALSLRSFNRASTTFAPSSSTSISERRAARISAPQQTARMALLAEGEKLPQFSAVDTEGKTVSNETLLGAPSILYFMAGAGPGCTQQSCGFRDAAAQLSGSNIVGISARNDGASFKAANSLNYPIVNDGDAKLQKLFGIPKTLGLIAGRVTFVSDKDGTVKKVFNSQFSFAEHIRIAKETVKQLEAPAS